MKTENKREIEFTIPRTIKDFCIEKLKFDLSFKDIKVKKVRNDKKSQLTTLILESSKDLNLHSVNLGALLNELKIKASAELKLKEVESKVDEGIEPIKLRFNKSIAKDFKELFEDELKIQKIVSVDNGKAIDVYFDVEHIKGRSQLVAHIAKILDSVSTVKHNKKDKQDSKDIQRAIQTLEANCNYLQKTQKSHERMIGKELIEKGFAMPFVSDDQKKETLFNQFFRLLKGKQIKPSLDYYYMNKLVELEKQYIVRLKQPEKIEPEAINHSREILDFYEYGEQLAKGQGIKEVENYFNTIIEKHNEIIQEESQDSGIEEL